MPAWLLSGNRLWLTLYGEGIGEPVLIQIFQLVPKPIISFLVYIDVAFVLSLIEGQLIPGFYERFHIKRTPFLPIVKVDIRIQHPCLYQ